jgi:hypothetical protein
VNISQWSVRDLGLPSADCPIHHFRWLYHRETTPQSVASISC